MKNWGKVIAMFLGVMIFLQMAVVPAKANAGLLSLIEPVPVIKDIDSTISLEQAIRIVKENFEIPAQYSDFTSGYNTFNNRQTWALYWASPEGNEGNFNAQVDAKTGDILNINSWNGSSNNSMHLPSVSYEDATQAAYELVKLLVPEKLLDLKLIPDNSQIIPLNNYGPVNYSIRWQRVVNGIPFKGDGITVQVNGDNKQITSYSLNWTDVKFPNADHIITAEKAKEIFTSTPMLEAKYYTSTYRPIPLAADNQKTAFLVYSLKNKYQDGAIDAITGKPVQLKNGQWLAKDGSAGAGMEDAKQLNSGSAPVEPAPLTPEEQKEIEKTAKLLSKEEAVAVVKKLVGIPDNLKLQSVNLGTDGFSRENRIWSLSWSNVDEQHEDKQPQYMYARVNAENGELIGYNISLPAPDDKVVDVLDRQSAQKLAEDFITKVQPERFKQTKLSENNGVQINENKEVPQNFVYQRLVNGIPYPSNNIYVTVDPVANRIISFNLNWSDTDFPSLDGMYNNNTASAVFLKNQPMTLFYVQMYNNGQPSEVRLVYMPQAVVGKAVSDIMDAKTGEFLNWNGKPVSQSPRAYEFNDITGNFAEKEIALLGQAGIFGEYGNTFKPDEHVTLISLLRAMLAAKNGIWYTQNMTDEELIKAAQEQNLLKEDLDNNSQINRLELVKLMIRFLGLEYVAKLQLVYQSPYVDTNNLPQDEIGYLALSKGFGLTKDDGMQFKSNLYVTRAEAAYAIIKVLSVDKH